MLLTHHIRQYKKTCYYQKLDIYYERCRLSQTLLNDEVGNRIDTYIKDYYLSEIYMFLKTILSCSFPIQLKTATGL